jgi:hypothetical protein
MKEAEREFHFWEVELVWGLIGSSRSGRNCQQIHRFLRSVASWESVHFHGVTGKPWISAQVTEDSLVYARARRNRKIVFEAKTSSARSQILVRRGLEHMARASGRTWASASLGKKPMRADHDPSRRYGSVPAEAMMRGYQIRAPSAKFAESTGFTNMVPPSEIKRKACFRGENSLSGEPNSRAAEPGRHGQTDGAAKGIGQRPRKAQRLSVGYAWLRGYARRVRWLRDASRSRPDGLFTSARASRSAPDGCDRVFDREPTESLAPAWGDFRDKKDLSLSCPARKRRKSAKCV